MQDKQDRKKENEAEERWQGREEKELSMLHRCVALHFINQPQLCSLSIHCKRMCHALAEAMVVLLYLLQGELLHILTLGQMVVALQQQQTSLLVLI